MLHFPIVRRVLRSVWKTAAVLALGLSATFAPMATASETKGFYEQWGWFENTYWIVPPEGIYSIYHLEEQNRFIVDRGQTVFHITDYFNGYFTGAVVVKLTTAQIPSCQFVLGQVTPEGRVHMTMYGAETGAVVNYPLGQMVRKAGQWTMVNQMTSVTQGGTLSHWAYMVQSKRGSLSFAKLPFAKVSIPEFMSSCPPGPKIDNVFEGQGFKP